MPHQTARLQALTAWLQDLPRVRGWTDVSLVLLAPSLTPGNPLRLHGFVGARGVDPAGVRLGVLEVTQGQQLITTVFLSSDVVALTLPNGQTGKKRKK